MDTFFNENLNDEDIRIIVGSKVANLRLIKRELTQAQLAPLIDYPNNVQVSLLESGKKPITITLILKLSKVFNVHPFYFLKGIVSFDINLG